MTPADFTARVAALGLTSKALPAARDVLLEGATINGAARAHNVHQPTVHRLVHRIAAVKLCPTCGHAIRQ